MTLSAISNPALTKGNISHQKTGASPGQIETDRRNASSEQTRSKSNHDDNVTLSQSERSHHSPKVLDGKAVEQLLPQTKESILADSKAALAAQANIIPQVAQEFLAES